MRTKSRGIAFIANASAIFADFCGSACRFGIKARCLAGFNGFAVFGADWRIRQCTFGLKSTFVFFANIMFHFAVFIRSTCIRAYIAVAFVSFRAIGYIKFSAGIACFKLVVCTDGRRFTRVTFCAISKITNIITGTCGFDNFAGSAAFLECFFGGARFA